MRRVLALPFLLLACSDDPGGGGPDIDSTVAFFEIPGRSPVKLDMLLVLDNTTGMASYQAELANLVAASEAALFGPDTAQPDFRLAVTTTDGTGNLESPAPHASAAFIAREYDQQLQPATNFTSFSSAFNAMIDVGAASATPSQPLESVQNALDANAATFVRDGSYLAVLLLTASDDASSGAVAAYATSLKGRKPDPTSVLVQATYAPPATRLDQFFAEFPNRAFTHDIATTDLSQTFGLVTSLLRTVLGVPCVREPLDVDPQTDGDQFDCDVSLVYADETTEVIRQCVAGTTARCYTFEPSPVTCESGYSEFKLKGFPTPYVPGVRGQCVVAAGG